jgi:7,8-dihydropterin-6-yl-methyl-4-(beta-D-ribofuranosyl)aminobenzene 5'-phosphate synthase
LTHQPRGEVELISTLSRRSFLVLGAVASGTFFLGGCGPLGSAPLKPELADVPTVDQLILTSVVDNVYDAFAQAKRFDNLTVQRTPNRLPSPLLAEHGLAFHLASLRGAERKQILLDFALTWRTLTNNYVGTKIDPAPVDALILSHGHFDHYGTLPNLVKAESGWKGRGMTLYAGGEDTFCHRWVVAADGQRQDFGQLDRTAIEDSGVKVVLGEQPNLVARHAVTSGHIQRVTDFEAVTPSFRLEASGPGSLCGLPNLHFPAGVVNKEVAPGELVPDIMWGEHGTAYNVKNRGLVVISSCGHAGIVNSIRQLQRTTGIEKIHAVVAGWHLAVSSDDVVKQDGQCHQGHESRLCHPDALHREQYRCGPRARDAEQANPALQWDTHRVRSGLEPVTNRRIATSGTARPMSEGGTTHRQTQSESIKRSRRKRDPR